MTVGPVLDEAIGSGAGVLLQRALAGGLDDLLRIDSAMRLGEAEEERRRRLLQREHDFSWASASDPNARSTTARRPSAIRFIIGPPPAP